MPNGDEALGPGPTQAESADDDPVVAFLFDHDPAEAQPERTPAFRSSEHSSRSISRLHNNRGTLYLPTLHPGRANRGAM
jgi:hypothetical protein